MRLPWSKPKEVYTGSIVVIDGNTWHHYGIVHEDELQVSDGQHSWPKKSLNRYYTESGEVIWLANAPRETLIATEDLEEVRRNNVLKNVFAYQKPLPNINYVIYIGLLVVLLVAVWRR